jgi:hypothetical protein
MRELTSENRFPTALSQRFNSYVCDSDQIMVDGVAWSIITVKVLY